jgi:hypothetical protein
MNSLWYLPATIKFSPMPPYGMNCVQGEGPITLGFPFKFMLGLIVWFQYYGTYQVSLTGIKKQLEREIRPINSCLAVRNQEERVWCSPNLNSHVDHFAFPFQPQCCIVLDVCKGAVKRVALDCEILNFVLLGLFLFVAVHLRFIYC